MTRCYSQLLRLHQLFIDFSKCIAITTAFDEHKTMRAHTYPRTSTSLYTHKYAHIQKDREKKREEQTNTFKMHFMLGHKNSSENENASQLEQQNIISPKIYKRLIM